MNMNELKVGMRVYLRDDLQEGVSYGHDIWSRYMHRGMWIQVVEIFDDGFSFYIKNGGVWGYTPEMIDWDKTLNRMDKTKEQETMNKLEVGMWVYLRDDLQENEKYGDETWVREMYKGIWVQIDKIYDEINAFRIYDQGIFIYTPEMIDWEKTKRGNETKDPEMIDWKKIKQECETSKSKLKFKLYNEGNLIIFSILEQCPSITRMDGDEEIPLNINFKSSNGFKFYSLTKTELNFSEIDGDDDNLIFLRGCYDYNQSPTTATFTCESEEEAKYIIKEMLKAFQEFKDNNYFKGKEDKTLKPNEENKYQVYEI